MNDSILNAPIINCCIIALTGSISFFLVCYAFAKIRESEYVSTYEVNDNDEEDGEGDQPISPKPTPFDIDPQKDPGDWWKHPTRNDN